MLFNFFPSAIGLLESGETSEEAVIRELHEETGWHGEPTHISNRLAIDPPCSSAIIRYATVKVINFITKLILY